MYNAYFGLSRRPFASAPLVDQYFPAPAIEAARQTLARCIERSEGAAMVVGPSGTGKTLLCQVLAAQFRDSLRVALLSSGRISTRRNLFQAILYELGQPYRGMDEGELRLALVDHLTRSDECSRGMVLLVDEAHSLPLRLFEEIRMLTNVAGEGQPQVRLVMAGGCLLEERFAHPKLDSFSQRLVARCYLEALARTETQDYIHALVDAAGGAGEEIFPPDTCQCVYQATDGVPRLVNQVCDHALLLAYAADCRQLEAAHVEEAWADLQQLPTPWTEQSPGEEAGGVIEFGGLEDASPEDDQPAVRKAALPPLRISPEAEHGDTPPTDPARQLEGIEQMLGSVENDFQPAGSIGPELELVFEDPFQEAFEKEEVVTDRYGPPQRPVADTDGPSEPNVAGQDGEANATDPGDRQQHPRGNAHQEPAVADDLDESPHAGPESVRETLPLHRQGPLEEPDDEDLLIVEDDYDDVATAAGSIVAVRRQEFGRLFTKLRRG